MTDIITRLKNPPFGTDTSERNLMSAAAEALVAKDAEIAKLREALEPFAKVAERDIGEDETDDDLFRPMMRHNRAPRLTVGDMRKALAALAGGPDA